MLPLENQLHLKKTCFKMMHGVMGEKEFIFPHLFYLGREHIYWLNPTLLLCHSCQIKFKCVLNFCVVKVRDIQGQSYVFPPFGCTLIKK